MSGDPTDIVRRIETERGRQFEQAIVDAFNFLGLNANLTGSTEAESDVIAEAVLAESPYFVVIECCAANEDNEVGYEKLGQIRGNFPTYLNERRQRIFKAGYKLVIGKPTFSSNARNRAEPDVGLISTAHMIELMQAHSTYYFPQDELEQLFGVKGELTDEHLRSAVEPYQRRISIYALIGLSLLVGRSISDENRRPLTPIEQIVGQVLVYSEMLQIPNVQDEDVRECIRDMSSPISKMIRLENESIRLSSVPIDRMTSRLGETGKELLSKLSDYARRLQVRL